MARRRSARVIPIDAARALRQQTVDADHPGPILRDFRTLLDFVGPTGLSTTGRYHLLPRSCLAELNARLRRPLDVRLKRPQQRSYPNLDGLYLVGRASGLLKPRGTGAKARLVVDETVRGSWDGLNAAERYFNLLEAWLVHARPEVLGTGRRSSQDGLFECMILWQSVPKGGLRPGQDRRSGRYPPGIETEFLHLALMDLFTYTGRLGESVRVLHPYCEEAPSTGDVRLRDLPLAEGEAMEFLYDFGDCWPFAVRLKRVDPPKQGFARPVVLESRGEAPPQYGEPEEEWDG
jgi:hypothetical protein